MKVLSHGAGVQTRALLRLVLAGEFEKPDMVVFADTQAEPEEVYRALAEDQAECERVGLPFHVVTHGDLSATDQWGGLYIPAYTLNQRGDRGMLRRQCTERFKVRPIRQLLRDRGATRKNPTELWLGISTDEAIRRKTSNVQYVKHRWPLLELEWSRDDCLAYLNTLGISATKSACVFCPYRSGEEWQRIRANDADWQAAIEYDEAVRDKRPAGGDVFVHPSRMPLAMAPVEDNRNQPGLWDSECGGHCGL